MDTGWQLAVTDRASIRHYIASYILSGQRTTLCTKRNLLRKIFCKVKGEKKEQAKLGINIDLLRIKDRDLDKMTKVTKLAFGPLYGPLQHPSPCPPAFISLNPHICTVR